MKLKLAHILLCALALVGCKAPDKEAETTSPLADAIAKITAEYPAEIGVAVITSNGDTVVVNDQRIYPMMSVFKLHQAIAVCNACANLDSVISVSRDSLDLATWSPMLREHSEQEISLPVKDCLRYALIQSDNNASNLMFSLLVDVSATDSLIATLIPRDAFQIAYTETDMAADHAKAYANCTSPLATAILINRLFTDSIIDPERQEFIKQSLRECATGSDRISAPLADIPSVTVAHKTGSGYVTDGILTAYNDVAYITLPNGRNYALAVFVKDLAGTESAASEAISRISATVYAWLARP